MIGVQFWTAQHGFQTMMTMQEARRIIDAFATKTLPETIGHHNVQTQDGMVWAMRTSQLVTIHTVPLNQQGQPGLGPGLNASGLPFGRN